MVLMKSESDNLNYQHHSFKQKYKGVTKDGAEYILHEQNGRIASANGFLVLGMQKSIIPSITTLIPR